MKKQMLSVVLTVVMLGASIGCTKKTVTNVPTGISPASVQLWYNAAGNIQLVAKYTRELTNATVQLKSEFPDGDTYQKTLEAFGRIDQLGIQASQFLETVPENWDAPTATKVAGYLDQMAAQLSVALDDGFAHVKNPSSLATYQTTIRLLRGVIKTAAAVTRPAGVN